MIEEFIEDFVAQAKDFREGLYKALELGDKDKLKIFSHKLKGVAANLRIEDALESLTTINTSENNDEIKVELDNFYQIISKLSDEPIENFTTATEKIHPTVIDDISPLEIEDTDFNNSEKSDFELEFKEELEDDFELGFKDDPVTVNVQTTTDKQAHQDIPELADDDFLLHLDEDDDTKDNLPDIEFNEDPLDIENELSDEVFQTPHISYSKEDVAYDIGIDQDFL